MQRSNFILRILRLPLEMLFFSFDFLYALRAYLIWLLGLQRIICPFCRGEDDMEMVPRPSMMAQRYHNLWLIRCLASCIQPPQFTVSDMPFCAIEGMHFKRRFWLAGIILLCWWSGIGAGAYLVITRYPGLRAQVTAAVHEYTGLLKPPSQGPVRPAPAPRPVDPFEKQLAQFNQSGRLSAEDPALNERIYRHLVEAKDWSRAGIAAAGNAELFPDNPQARSVHLEHLYPNADYTSFNNEAISILVIDPAHPPTLLLRAKKALAREEFHEAGMDLQKILPVEDASVGLLGEAGLLFYLLEDDRSAWKCFDRCLEIDPRSSPGLMGKLLLASRANPKRNIDTSSLGGTDWTLEDATYLMLAHLYTIREDWSRSLRVAQQVLDRNPTQYDHAYWLAQVWLEHNQLEAALIIGETLIQSEFLQGRIAGHRLKAETFVRRKQYQEAIQATRRLLREEPNHEIAHRLSARSYRAIGEYSHVLVHARDVLRLAPDDLEALLLQGESLIQIADTVGGLEAYRLASRTHPRDASADLALARHFEGQQRYGQAIDHYREVIRRDPGRISALKQLAEMRFEDGVSKHVKAIQQQVFALNNRGELGSAFALARRLKDDRVLAIALEGDYSMAQLFYALGRYRESVEAAERIIATHPRHLDARLLLARNQERLGNLAACLEHLEYLLRRRPVSLEGWRLMGRLRKTDPDKAADRLFERIILEALHPNLLRGLYLYGQQEYELSQGMLEKALQARPDDPDVAYLLLELLNTRNDTSGRGLRLITQFGKKFPQHAALAESAGQYLILQGESERAQVWLEAALRRFPDNGNLHRMLGTLLLEAGKIDEGILHLETALNFASGDFEADTIRSLLKASAP